MKTKKWIVGLLSVSSIGAIAPMVTSCADKTNQPEELAEYPKVREVGKKAERTYFYIKQYNVNAPESTKVKMVNLYVNGAAAKPVEGLIKYQADSGGNIRVIFNMSLAVSHYGANTVAFDLQLTNKVAGTEWTIDGYEVKLSTKGYNITYPAESEIPGITWGSTPEEHIDLDVDYEMQFQLEEGCKFIDIDNADLLVGATSMKGKTGVTFELLPYPNKSTIILPSEYISDDITIKFKTDGTTYDVTKAGDDEDYFAFNGASIIKHGKHTDIYNATIKVDSQFDGMYMFADDNPLVIKTGDKALSQGEDYTLTFNEHKTSCDITIYCDKVVGNVSIIPTKKNATHKVSVVSPHECFYSLMPDSPIAEYSVNTTFTFKMKPNYTLVKSKIKCGVYDYDGELKTTLTYPDDIDIKDPTDSDDGKITIHGDKITGDLKLTTTEAGKTISIDKTGVTGFDTVSGNLNYMQSSTLRFGMTSGYYWSNGDDFKGDNPNIKFYNGDSQTAITGITIGTDDQYITIPEGFITDNLKIKGEITHYITTPNLVGFKDGSQKEITYAKEGDPSFTTDIALLDTYANPTVTITGGKGDWGSDDYSVIVDSNRKVKVTFTEAGQKKVTSPLSISITAVETSISIVGQQKLAVGDTTTDPYSVTVSTGGTADLALTTESQSLATLNTNKTLTANATEGKATLKATYQGLEKTLDVDIAKPEYTIKKGEATSATMNVGDKLAAGALTYSCTSELKPAATISGYKWSTTDTAGVIEIDESTGAVTAKKEGTATINVSIWYGTLTEATAIKSKDFTIEVKAVTANVTYDDSFSTNGVTIDTTSGKSPTSIEHTKVGSTTLSVYGTASGTVKGKILVKDGENEVASLDNQTFNTTETKIDITITDAGWSQVTSGAVTVSFKPEAKTADITTNASSFTDSNITVDSYTQSIAKGTTTEVSITTTTAATVTGNLTLTSESESSKLITKIENTTFTPGSSETKTFSLGDAEWMKISTGTTLTITFIPTAKTAKSVSIDQTSFAASGITATVTPTSLTQQESGNVISVEGTATAKVTGKLKIAGAPAKSGDIITGTETVTFDTTSSTWTLTLTSTEWKKIWTDDDLTVSFIADTKTADVSYTDGVVTFNQTKSTTSLTKGSVDTITIKGTATESVTGTITVTGGAGTITTLENETFDTTESEHIITLDDDMWKNISTKETLTVTFAKAVIKTATLNYDSLVDSHFIFESPQPTTISSNETLVIRMTRNRGEVRYDTGVVLKLSYSPYTIVASTGTITFTAYVYQDITFTIDWSQVQDGDTLNLKAV